jgi:predicted dehydrogenase
MGIYQGERRTARNGSARRVLDEPGALDELASTRKRARLRFGVIGYGYWGPQLVRNLDQLQLGAVTHIADLSPERQQVARLERPMTRVTGSFDEVLRSDVDAIAIATPIRTHHELARAALERGKHVLVEKPLTASTAEAEDLVALSQRLGLTLMVGHTYMYNPAVEELRRLIQDGALGRVYYIDAVRVNLGIFRQDHNVMWDLAPHDLSILNHVLDMYPLSVSAHGGAYVRRDVHDIVYLTLRYPGELLAHVQVSWLNPAKVRRFTIVGDQRMVVYDDVEPTEKIRIYDRGVDAPAHTSNFGDFQLSYRYGNIVSPYIRWAEPLALQCRHFAESIMESKPPRSDGRNGLSVVRILEAAEASLQSGGAFVVIPAAREQRTA